MNFWNNGGCFVCKKFWIHTVLISLSYKRLIYRWTHFCRVFIVWDNKYLQCSDILTYFVAVNLFVTIMNFLNITWKWEYICGPQGLAPWNDTTKDIGICFQELFLQIPTFFILAITSGYYMGFRRNWVVREKTQERSITLRSFVALALVAIPIIHLYVIISDDQLKLYPIDYFAAGAACISWLVHFGYVIALKHRLGQSSRGPMCQLILWSLLALLSVIELRSNILIGSPTSFGIAIVCFHVVYLLTLLPASDSRPTFYSPCLVGSQHSHVSSCLFHQILVSIQHDFDRTFWLRFFHFYKNNYYTTKPHNWVSDKKITLIVVPN